MEGFPKAGHNWYITMWNNTDLFYLAKCWGGRVTDKFITRESGFLKLIDPGDSVIADRSFDLSDDIAFHGGKLEIPSFTKGKKQLTQKEVEVSQKL